MTEREYDNMVAKIKEKAHRDRIAQLEKQIDDMHDFWENTVAPRVKPDAREAFKNGQWGLLCIDFAEKRRS